MGVMTLILAQSFTSWSMSQCLSCESLANDKALVAARRTLLMSPHKGRGNFFPSWMRLRNLPVAAVLEA